MKYILLLPVCFMILTTGCSNHNTIQDETKTRQQLELESEIKKLKNENSKLKIENAKLFKEVNQTKRIK